MTMQLKSRIKAFGIHAVFSVAVSALAALLVFGFWFPGAYREMCGGLQLFFLLTSVDVVARPLLTFFIVSGGKSKMHLALDLSVVALLQLMALAYGLYVVSQSRPVVLAAENSLFRVVTARDVKLDELAKAPEGLRTLSWRGPLIVGVRASRNSDEMAQSIDWALRGYDAGTRPGYWQPYSHDGARVLQQAMPLTGFSAKSEWHKSLVEAAARGVGSAPNELSVTPVVARQSGWYALLDAKSAEVKGFARLDQEGN